MGPQDDNVALVMDRAYQGDETRQLALDLGFTPVVPPLKTRTDPWEYDREMLTPMHGAGIPAQRRPGRESRRHHEPLGHPGDATARSTKAGT